MYIDIWIIHNIYISQRKPWPIEAVFHNRGRDYFRKSPRRRRGWPSSHHPPQEMTDEDIEFKKKQVWSHESTRYFHGFFHGFFDGFFHCFSMVFPWVFPWVFPMWFHCLQWFFPLFLGRLLVKNDHKTPTRTDSVKGIYIYTHSARWNWGFSNLVLVELKPFPAGMIHQLD